MCRVGAMSDIQMKMESGESNMSALLTMLKYVREELSTIDPISQFCVDMAIRQLRERERSAIVVLNAVDESCTIQ
jgi:septation ring formation regulator EzrA